MRKIVKVLNKVGSYIEKLITGSSEYKFTTSSFEKAEIIDNSVQAKIAMDEVTEQLEKDFSIKLISPVIIHLGKPQTAGWKQAVIGENNHVGNYTQKNLKEHNAHNITIVPGLERKKFKAVLAHEMTHAFQAENKLLRTHKSLKEGMARWVEYHFLQSSGLKHEADKLLRYQRYILGRSLTSILEHENQGSRSATLNWLKSLEKE